MTRRLLGAFLAVAAAAIGAFAALTLWAGRGNVADLVRQQQRTTASDVAAAVADAYVAGGGWASADLRPARALALSANALLEVRSSDGTLVLQAARGYGAGMGAGMGQMHGAPTPADYGTPRVVAVEVRGARVGTASLAFPRDTLPPAERQLRDALTRTTLYGILIAAAAALLAGLLVAKGIVRPLRRLTAAVQRLGAGDRSARANLEAPGELGELAAAVDAMAAALEREDELRRALTADVAHELRTPVTILAGQCEAMLDGVSEPSPEQIGSLHEEVLRLGRVIEDLETLAAAEAAALRLDRERVDLAAVVERAAELLRPQFDVDGVALELRLEPATVTGDELRLAQVVRNLLSNALKFTPAGGHAAVSLARRDGAVELAVRDDGRGIPPAELPHVFERFWRGSNGSAAAGSGVGLAVVAELVRAHGGTVTAASEPGRGARFTVSLPAS